MPNFTCKCFLWGVPVAARLLTEVAVLSTQFDPRYRFVRVVVKAPVSFSALFSSAIALFWPYLVLSPFPLS